MIFLFSIFVSIVIIIFIGFFIGLIIITIRFFLPSGI